MADECLLNVRMRVLSDPDQKGGRLLFGPLATICGRERGLGLGNGEAGRVSGLECRAGDAALSDD